MDKEQRLMKRLACAWLVIVGLLAGGGIVHAAGTMAVTERVDLTHPYHGKKITVSWTADAADGSLPNNLDLAMGGLVLKVVTNPGATAPTDNYDIACGDPNDSTLDVFATTLNNRDTANTEQVYPVVSGATAPVYVSHCTLQITNNSVNSATGAIHFYVLKP